ncbi:MAG: hypothetical protein ABSD44_05665 [Terracidiphilus sp.]
MTKRLFRSGLLRVALVLAGAALCAVAPAPAQRRGGRGGGGSDADVQRAMADRLPGKPTLPPVFTFPVAPLGFSAPGPKYFTEQTSLVSLDFLDEDRLLFTFRVPGLIRREVGESDAGDERQIRAEVLSLSAGRVEAEALWTVHDRARYLWMFRDGHFLLRDRDSAELGDATLERKPYLRFPGSLLTLEMDPSQQFLVADTREPAAVAEKAGETSGQANHPGDKDPPSHPSEKKSFTGERKEPGAAASQPSLVVRILRRDSGQVLLVSRTRTAVHLPINADGYLERLHAKGDRWLMNLKSFSGGSTVLGQLDSTCPPLFDFVSQREVLATACNSFGSSVLVAFGADGRRIWESETTLATTWPLLVMAPDGSRLARESLAINRPITKDAPLDQDAVKGQLVEVFNAADGKPALVTEASPALDAGGNLAFSPSGRRIAVLNGGQIEVFDLPAAPPVPEPASHPKGR